MLLESIVIGSNLESLVYAFMTDSYFLPNSNGPMFYEELDSFILSSKRKDYTWSRFQTILALSGKLLNYKDIKDIRVFENYVKISSSDGLFKYEFDVCKIFDASGVTVFNEIKESKNSEYIVHDDFELSQLGAKHEYLKPKKSKDTLASDIYFYTSSRVDGAKYVTDCVARSTLTKDQINDVDYSDSMVRFCVLKYLESIGINGNFMNFYKNGNPKYRKPKVTHKKRMVQEKEQTRYKDSEKVKFLDLTMADILDEISSTRA